MIQRLGAVVLPLVLAGCAIPPAISIASLAADAISLAISEKTVTDHAISQIAQQDCAIWRGLTGGQLCINEDMTDIAVASGPDQPGADAVVNLSDIDDAEDWSMTVEEEVTGEADDAVAFRSSAWRPDPLDAPGTDVPGATRRRPEAGPAIRPDGMDSFAIRSRSGEPRRPAAALPLPPRSANVDGSETFADLSRIREIGEPPPAVAVNPETTAPKPGRPERIAFVPDATRTERGGTGSVRAAGTGWPATNAGLYYVFGKSWRWAVRDPLVDRRTRPAATDVTLPL